jgi:hypothetical protein
MKLLALKLFIIIAVYLAGLAMCSEAPIKKDSGTEVIEPVSDTVAKIPDYPTDTIGAATLKAFRDCDSVIRINNALLRRRDSLETALFISLYKIQRVKYYLAIVDRKPSQGKFLRSWITRAVK